MYRTPSKFNRFFVAVLMVLVILLILSQNHPAPSAIQPEKSKTFPALVAVCENPGPEAIDLKTLLALIQSGQLIKRLLKPKKAIGKIGIKT